MRHFSEGPKIRHGRPLALAVLASAALVAGCADGFTPSETAKARPVEQVAVPEPAVTAGGNTVSVTSRKAPPRMTRSSPAAEARETIEMSVLYYERILVPAGSTLTIRAEGAGDAAPTIKRSAVGAGMPYKVSVPVGAGPEAYPMTVDATLESGIGHVMTGSVTLAERPSGPVELVIRTKAD